MISPFNHFLNGDNKTIFKIWNNSLSWVPLSSNQNYQIDEEMRWRERDRDRGKNGCFHWTLISPSLKPNCWVQLRDLIPDAHSKHIPIVLVVDSQNFRKLKEWFSEFERDENMTQKRKSIRLLIKRWSFSWMSILRPQNSISGLLQMMLFCL